MAVEIGPRQRAALCRLRWRPDILPADDKVMASLARRSLVTSRNAFGGAEWRITFDGLVAIGAVVDDRETPELEAA